MRTNLTKEQEFRYLNDAEFHARVTVVARALWSAVARWDLKHSTPYSVRPSDSRDTERSRGVRHRGRGGAGGI